MRNTIKGWETVDGKTCDMQRRRQWPLHSITSTAYQSYHDKNIYSYQSPFHHSLL